MRVDVHAHYFPWAYVQRINEAFPQLQIGIGARRMPGAGGDAAEIEARLAQMDRAGVDVQIFSVASNFPYVEHEPLALDLARQANDLFADLVSRHPTRFAAFAVLPLPHIDASLKEMERAFGQLRMVGVTIGTSVGRRPVSDPAFDPVYEEMNRRGTVLFGHALQCGIYAPMLEDFFRVKLSAGPTIENSLFPLHLMRRQIPQRFARIKIICPHLGGLLPIRRHMIDTTWKFSDKAVNDGFPSFEPPSVTMRRMWYDTMCVADPIALRAAHEAFGGDRIVLGTDFPYADYLESVSYIRNAGLPEADVDKILDQTAVALFGFDAGGFPVRSS